MNWIIEHWKDIADVIVYLMVASRIVVKLTPTPKDDTAWDTVAEALKHLGLHVSTKRPELKGLNEKPEPCCTGPVGPNPV